MGKDGEVLGDNRSLGVCFRKSQGMLLKSSDPSLPVLDKSNPNQENRPE